MTEATPVDTLPSDIEAFKHRRREDIEHMSQITADIVSWYGKIEIFSFSAPEVGDITFNVRGIKDALASGKLPVEMWEIDLPLSLVEHVLANNGVEEERIAMVDDTRMQHPGIMVQWPTGHSTVIDGNHRLVARWRKGLRTFRFAIVVIDETLLPYMALPGEEKKFMPEVPGSISLLKTGVIL